MLEILMWVVAFFALLLLVLVRIQSIPTERSMRERVMDQAIANHEKGGVNDQL